MKTVQLNLLWNLKLTVKLKLIHKNWKQFVNEGIIEKMDFIENTFISENELDLDTANQLVDEISIITKAYNRLSDAYNNVKQTWTSIRINRIKDMCFYMRGWLSNYYSKIFPNDNIKLSQSTNLDSPKVIPKDLFNED